MARTSHVKYTQSQVSMNTHTHARIPHTHAHTPTSLCTNDTHIACEVHPEPSEYEHAHTRTHTTRTHTTRKHVTHAHTQTTHHTRRITTLAGARACKLHAYLTHTHALSLQVSGGGSGAATGDSVCSRHPGEKLHLYCRQCELSICRQCGKSAECTQHPKIPLTQATEESHQSLGACVCMCVCVGGKCACVRACGWVRDVCVHPTPEDTAHTGYRGVPPELRCVCVRVYVCVGECGCVYG